MRKYVALAAAAALLLTACSGGDGPPEGWTRVEESGMRFDVPDSWVDTGGLNERWTMSWQDVEGDDASIQLAAAPALGHYTALEAQGLLMASAQIGGLPGYEVVENRDDLGVSNRELTRLDFTYEPEEGTVYDGVLLTAARRDGQAVALQVTGTDLDDATVEHLQESLAVVATDETAVDG